LEEAEEEPLLEVQRFEVEQQSSPSIFVVQSEQQ